MFIALGLVVVVLAAYMMVASAIDGAEGKTSSELYAIASKRAKAAVGLRDKAKAENRALTDDEEAQIDELMADAETAKALGDTAKVREDRNAKLDTLAANMNAPQPRPSRAGPTPPADANLMPDEIAVSSGHHDRLLDDPSRGFTSLGEQAMVVAQAMTPGGGAADERLKVLAAASGVSQGQSSSVGFLVAPTFSNKIWDGMSADPDNIMNLCDIYTVDGESLTMNRENETSRADGSRDGGTLAYWLQEAQQITSSKPENLGQLKLEPHELGVLIYATNKSLRNSPIALSQYLTRKGQRGITFKVCDAIINGDGVGKPLGILSSDALVEQAKETGQAAASIDFHNIRKMRGRMVPSMRSQWIWICNQEIPALLETMKMVVGTGGVPVYLPAGGISQDGYSVLYARQVRELEYCQAPGTVGDIVAWAPKSYALGLRGGVESAMSIHLRFDYADTAFRLIFEADGQPWPTSALTPYKGTLTLSPMVALAARS